MPQQIFGRWFLNIESIQGHCASITHKNSDPAVKNAKLLPGRLETESIEYALGISLECPVKAQTCGERKMTETYRNNTFDIHSEIIDEITPSSSLIAYNVTPTMRGSVSISSPRRPV
jgi:hypothetical protein